ncbi:MAG: hypothetical protein K9J27_11550 [Bacteroidales bacterium]|nr:hypothetical protein [Bacteroidales bacterium]
MAQYERAQVDVNVNGKDANKQLSALEKQAEKYRKELEQANRSGDLEGYKKAKKNLEQVTKETKQLKKQTYSVNKVVNNLSTATYNDLRKAARQLNREMSNMNRNTKEYAEKQKQLGAIRGEMSKHKKAVRGGSKAWEKFRQILPIAGIGAAVAGIGRLTRNMINLATTMQSENRRANIVFGDSLDEVEKKTGEFADQLGVTDRKAAALAATTGDMLVPLGFARDQAADMSTEALKLAGALDEWTGGVHGVEGSLEAINSAVTGEMEQLKKFGIVIRQNDEEFLELKETLMETKGVTEQQAKAMATLQLIQEKSVDAQNSFNTEGNKLLRTQKRMKRGWSELKESVIGWFNIDKAEKLKQERKEVNQLAVKLTDANIKEEERKEVLEKLRRINPQIVEGLDSENIQIEKLRDNLEQYNEALARRITLANLEKEEEEKLADLSKEMNKREKERIELSQLMMKANEDLATSEGTFEEKLQRVTQNLQDRKKALEEAGQAGIKKVVAGTLVDTRAEELKLLEKITLRYNQYKQHQEKVNELQQDQQGLKSRQETMKEILGITEKINEEEKNGSDMPEEKKKSYEELFNTLERAHEKNKLKLEQQLAEEKITQSEYNTEMLVEEESYLQGKLALQERYGEDTLETEKKLAQKEQEINKLKNQHMLDFRKEVQNLELKSFEDIEEKIDKVDQKNKEKLIQNYEEWSKKMDQLEQQRNQKARQNLEQKLQTTQQMATQMGQIIGQAAADSNMTLEEAGEQMLVILLDQLKKFVRMQIVKATVGSLASAESIATFGAAGLAKAAVLTGLIEAAFAGIKSMVLSDSGGGGGSPKVPQRAEGNLDVVGQDDGKTYRNVPYTGRFNGVGVVNQGRPALINETGDELIVDSATTNNIRMKDPGVFDLIKSYQVPQRAEGNLADFNNDTGDLRRSIDMMNRNNAYLAETVNGLRNQLKSGIALSARQAKEELDKLDRMDQNTSV